MAHPHGVTSRRNAIRVRGTEDARTGLALTGNGPDDTRLDARDVILRESGGRDAHADGEKE
jgi:hypothetical protein